MIYPFRDGNGLTQKIFIEKVADKLGYSLQLEKIDSKKFLEVTIDSVNGTGRSLKKVFEEFLVSKHFKSKSDQLQISSRVLLQQIYSKK